MKDRKLLKKEWETLRAEVENIIKTLELSADSFKAVSLHKWQSIEAAIGANFLKTDGSKVNWWWEHFKNTYYSTQANIQHLPEQLTSIIKDEIVYLVLFDGFKMWYYEGTRETVIRVIWECASWSEYYIISKKYKWLLCHHHHDGLIGVGSIVSVMKLNK